MNEIKEIMNGNVKVFNMRIEGETIAFDTPYNSNWNFMPRDFEQIIDTLQQENEEYKEVIDKIDKKINDFIKCCKAEKIESGSDFLHHSYWNMFENFNKQIKEILKEVKK